MVSSPLDSSLEHPDAIMMGTDPLFPFAFDFLEAFLLPLMAPVEPRLGAFFFFFFWVRFPTSSKVLTDLSHTCGSAVSQSSMAELPIVKASNPMSSLETVSSSMDSQLLTLCMENFRLGLDFFFFVDDLLDDLEDTDRPELFFFLRRFSLMVVKSSLIESKLTMLESSDKDFLTFLVFCLGDLALAASVLADPSSGPVDESISSVFVDKSIVISLRRLVALPSKDLVVVLPSKEGSEVLIASEA